MEVFYPQPCMPSGGLLRRSSVEGGGCDLVAAALPLWGEESELVESSSSEEEDDGASPGGTRKAQRNKNTPATRRARGKSDIRARDPAEAFLGRACNWAFSARGPALLDDFCDPATPFKPPRTVFSPGTLILLLFFPDESHPPSRKSASTTARFGASKSACVSGSPRLQIARKAYL